MNFRHFLERSYPATLRYIEQGGYADFCHPANMIRKLAKDLNIHYREYDMIDVTLNKIEQYLSNMEAIS